MSVAEIINIMLPLKREDYRCGFKMARKLKARAEMILLINDYREGKNVVLPDEVKELMSKTINYV
jgi:hypothetical protein